ncbi:hypothetical protein NC651_020395 [Populus alba x Populus x berolinensis]|nr:hypothetical protein NC651_020395 [Populus alba x Populus x berolinensis]
MASFSVEDFVGNGVLKDLLPTLLKEGWDDVPTLKIMNKEDTDAMNMTQQQKVGYLEFAFHFSFDQNLMHWKSGHTCMIVLYCNMGISWRPLGNVSELLSTSTVDLSSQFGMKRGHVARFVDRTSACADPLLKSYAPLTARNMNSIVSRNNSNFKSYASVNSRKMQASSSMNHDKPLEQSLADFKIKDDHIFKGIVAAGPAEHRACGCVQPPPIVDSVAPYYAIEKISVQKLTPEYKIGMERLVKTKTPPMKASELWRDKPAVIFCIRRPGAEAHQIYAKKPIFDALGIRLFAVLHEHIESEVKDFWPRYWGGVVLFDRSMKFFKALGGGRLLKDNFISGFIFNPRTIANYKRAKATGSEQNFKGEGEIKGGLFIVGRENSGIAYQFIERNFGDWAPLAEVIDICRKLQNQQQSRGLQKHHSNMNEARSLPQFSKNS